MGRRHRHLNLAALGFRSHFDARFTAGTDGATVQTWSNRVSGVNDATQATAGARPTYRLRSANGQPSLQFVESVRGGLFSANGATIGVTRPTLLSLARLGRTFPLAAGTIDAVLAASIRSNNNPTGVRHGCNITHSNSYQSTTLPHANMEYGLSNTTSTSASTINCNGVSVDGVTPGNILNNEWIITSQSPPEGASASDVAMFAIGTFATTTPNSGSKFFYNGHVAVAAYAPFVVDAASLKRAHHSIAFSFKVPCS